VPTRRPRRRRKGAAIFTSLLVLVLAVGGYFAYSAFRHVQPFIVGSGCQAGSGTNAISLDTEQANVAATIAGVAAHEHLPRHAVTIAYATAMQESHLHNLSYGDLDSVGVFQQRPSEGWGTTAQLENPVYATTKFFGALVQVHGYLNMPVDQAAQAVQHSADGSAYSQYDLMASAMTSAFTGQWARSVWCWYTPGPQPKTNFAAASEALATTFGVPGPDRAVLRFTTSRSEKSPVAAVRVRSAAAWTVASWLVTHAQVYGISDVRYAGYEWQTANGGQGWQPDAGSASGSILLH
jgi:hypothetical protein